MNHPDLRRYFYKGWRRQWMKVDPKFRRAYVTWWDAFDLIRKECPDFGAKVSHLPRGWDSKQVFNIAGITLLVPPEPNNARKRNGKKR